MMSDHGEKWYGGTKWLRHRLGDFFSQMSFNAPCRLLKDEVKTGVNYVWINKEPFEGGKGYLCGVPLKYIDKALDNARKYPQARVNIWIDKNLLDSRSLFFLDSHIYLNALENVEIRDLHDIPAYHDLNLFDPDSDDFASLWARVDLARLLALDYCLSQGEVSDAFYADFDVEDVKITSRKVKDSLDKYGLVFGRVRSGAIENGYMAFRINEKQEFLKGLIKTTVMDLSPGHCNNGFFSYHNAVNSWIGESYRKEKKVSVSVLNEINYTIPDNPYYFEIGVNAPANFRG